MVREVGVAKKSDSLRHYDSYSLISPNILVIPPRLIRLLPTLKTVKTVSSWSNFLLTPRIIAMLMRHILINSRFNGLLDVLEISKKPSYNNSNDNCKDSIFPYTQTACPKVPQHTNRFSLNLLNPLKNASPIAMNLLTIQIGRKEPPVDFKLGGGLLQLANRRQTIS